MNWINAALITAATAGTARFVIPPLYRAGRQVVDDVRVRRMERMTFNEKLRQTQMRADMRNLRVIPGNDGQMGVAFLAGKFIANLDTGRVIGLDGLPVHIEPDRERAALLERLLRASPAHPDEAIRQVERDDVSLLPERVSVEDVMDAAPSYRRLVLGQSEHGLVTADLADLVHVAIGGVIGWGKSMFLRWLVYQLVKSTDPVQLAFIDLENATLAPFAKCDRLLWPVADTETRAAAILRELVMEVDRRKELYRQYEDYGIDSMYAYNEMADEPLVPIVCVVDEATVLLDDRAVATSLRHLVLRARKYGVWVMLSGQDWKVSSIDSSTRNHLGARIQFRAADHNQSRVLLNIPGAENIDVKGRAIAVRPGKPPVTFQSPLVKMSEIRALRHGSPMYDMPVAPEVETRQDQEARVLELHEQGLSNRQIETDVFGYNGGQATKRVKDIIESATT